MTESCSLDSLRAARPWKMIGVIASLIDGGLVGAVTAPQGMYVE